jgi:hypothetical protein
MIRALISAYVTNQNTELQAEIIADWQHCGVPVEYPVCTLSREVSSSFFPPFLSMTQKKPAHFKIKFEFLSPMAVNISVFCGVTPFDVVDAD